MKELKEILDYAESNNMMNQEFQTVLNSYNNYIADYYESLVADDINAEKASEEFYANAV